MTAKSSSSQRLLWEGIGLVLVSAGSLCFEINLTRLFSVSQFYHFAFMVVSMALLGYGVSGTVLALAQNKQQKAVRNNLTLLAAASAICMLSASLVVNHVPFDSFSIIVDPSQLGILFLHYTLLSSPFFFSGMIISLMLRKHPVKSSSVYALNLTGSSVGCLLAVISPNFFDGEGVVALSAVFCAFGGLFFLFKNKHISSRSRQWRSITLFLTSITLILALVPITHQIITGEIPGFFKVTISPYKSLSYALQSPDSQIISSQWNSISRVDIVESPSLHSIPGLSYRYLEPLPDVEGLFIDGDNLNAILPSDDPVLFNEYLPFSIVYQLQQNPNVLILGSKGGMEVQAAKASGANNITAVEGNPLVINAAEHIYFQPGINFVSSSGRSFIRSSDQKFDIIQLPLTDSYHPVSSGAYSLGEDYRYTIQAFEDMIDILQPDGILVLTRWLQETPSEWLRTFVLAVTAAENKDLDPQQNIIALRGYNTGTLLVKKSPFKMVEIDRVRTFAQEKAYDLVTMPTLAEKEVNQYNILPEPIYYQTFNTFLNSKNQEDFYDAYPYDVTPPTDDHPFYNHFFKWSQMDEILRSLGETWQPFGGAGYLVILIVFIFALILSSALILIPVIFKTKTETNTRNGHIPLYFGAIGLAFMLVEMPLIQRFILILDQPTYAMAAILFGILLFSGIGSQFGTPKLSLSTALILLVSLLVLYLPLLPAFLNLTLGWSLGFRLLVTMILIAPLGFLMGIPFSGGLNWIRSISEKTDLADQWMVSFVWAVNGASSVVGSILASLITLSFGFSITFGVGIVFYLIAYFVYRKKYLLT